MFCSKHYTIWRAGHIYMVRLHELQVYYIILQLSSPITFSAMASGLYKIIMQGENIGVQRTIALTAGTPTTITFTVRIS